MKAFVNARLVFPNEVCNGVVLTDNGIIIASGNVVPPNGAEIIDVDGAYLGPGLFDIHVHGYSAGGVDNDSYSADQDPVGMAKAHLREGTTSITPSAAYSWSQSQFLDCIHGCKAAIASGKSSIEGIHFEGPFTNPRRGASSEQAWTFSKDICDYIFNEAGADVLHCTYAPELPFAPELEDYLIQRGTVMDIGHTELSRADAERAVSKGAKIVTHIFDAMGGKTGYCSNLYADCKNENPDSILLDFPDLYYEMICDSKGVHVNPESVKYAYEKVGEDRIILISDSIGECSYSPSNYPQEDPRSAPDLNYNDRGQLSGSRLVLAHACQNFMRFTGADVRVAFKCASTNPAKALGLEGKVGSIFPGRDANLLIVDKKFRIKDVYFHGERIQT